MRNLLSPKTVSVLKDTVRWALILFALFHFAMRLSAAETASSVLKHLYNRFNNQPVEVTFRVMSPGASPKGVIVLDKDRFTIKSDDLSTWYDGTTQWTLSHSINEVNVITPTPEELAEINPLLIMRSMSTLFNAELGDAPAGQYLLKLVSKDKDYPISSATIKIKNNEWTPTEVTVVSNTGERYSFIITKVNDLGKIEKNCFRFNPADFPGVQVIDLR